MNYTYKELENTNTRFPDLFDHGGVAAWTALWAQWMPIRKDTPLETYTRRGGLVLRRGDVQMMESAPFLSLLSDLENGNLPEPTAV